MELAKSPAENWASDEQLLGYMLAMPKADHAEAVAAVLDGDEYLKPEGAGQLTFDKFGAGLST